MHNNYEFQRRVYNLKFKLCRTWSIRASITLSMMLALLRQKISKIFIARLSYLSRSSHPRGTFMRNSTLSSDFPEHLDEIEIDC